MDHRFYLVWHDPHLRQRIFAYARPPVERFWNGDYACYLDYPEAIFYSPFKMRFSKAAMNWAATHGNLRLVKWLHDRGEECTSAAMDGVARNGHLAVVQWLHKHRSEACHGSAVVYAQQNRHFEVAAYLMEHHPWSPLAQNAK